MKNDIAFAMSMFALAFVLWRGGQKLNAENISWIVLLSLVTLTVKFSGFVAVMLVPLLLGLRALMPMPWLVLGKNISRRFHRLLIAGGVTLLAGSISYTGIWAVYGFRFRPTPEKGVYLNLPEIIQQVRKNELIAEYHGSPPPGMLPGDSIPLPARAALFANAHGLLPQAFIAGFLFTYANAIARFAYLCGQISQVGWWWYFPFAILVKTPIATLIAAALAGVFAARACFGGRFKDGARQWTVICLALPVVLFLGSAMSSNLNIGLRHVLSIYPFTFVAIGCVAASAWKKRQGRSRQIIVALGLVLAVESLSAFPNFIPYFNVVASNVPGGKLELLGDSNLDWGQDLPLLAQWQREHPNDTLYLSYFGYADPVYYGIKYIPLPGGYHYDPPPHWIDPYSRSVIAISASNLQGFLEDPQLRKPIAVLGDSIYLFQYDPARIVAQR
jgi:hypothetical protein